MRREGPTEVSLQTGAFGNAIKTVGSRGVEGSGVEGLGFEG